MTGHDYARLLYLGLILLALGGWLVVHARAQMGRTLQNAAIWALIFLGAVAVAGLWPDIRDAVAPRQQAMQTADGTVVEVALGQDGHYRLTLGVNGVPTIFFVDTGATEVVLSRRDAEAAGIDTGALDYLGTAMTANGPVRTARVFLDSVELEGVQDAGVPAVVTEGALDASLLGMTYLGRFARIEIAEGRLILTR